MYVLIFFVITGDVESVHENSTLKGSVSCLDVKERFGGKACRLPQYYSCSIINNNEFDQPSSEPGMFSTCERDIASSSR